MGIYIFGFRIGEYAIFSSLLFITLYFLNNKYKLFEIFKENMVNNLTYLLFVTFLIFLLFQILILLIPIFSRHLHIFGQ